MSSRVFAHPETLFIGSQRRFQRKLYFVSRDTLLLQLFRCQFVKVRVALLGLISSADQAIVGQDDNGCAAFAIESGGPGCAFNVSRRAAENDNSIR